MSDDPRARPEPEESSGAGLPILRLLLAFLLGVVLCGLLIWLVFALKT